LKKRAAFGPPFFSSLIRRFARGGQCPVSHGGGWNVAGLTLFLFTPDHFDIMVLRSRLPVLIAAFSAMSALSCATLVQAQTDPVRVYRCPDNTYTNDLSEVKAKNCKLIDNANVSILASPGMPPKVIGSGSKAAEQRPSSANQAARVAPSTQKERDAEARRILESELQQQQARLAQQLKDYNNGQPEYLPSERIVGGGIKGGQYQQRVASMKDQIAMTQANIAALQRELQKYPQ
jgi:hypothetical protein